MHCKSIVRNLLVAFAVFTVVATGITVLVLAASGDSVQSPAYQSSPSSSHTSEQAEVLAGSNVLNLVPQQQSMAEVHLLHTDEAIPYETVTIEDPTMKAGKQVVDTEGRDGLVRHTVEIILHDGQEVARQDAGSRMIREPVNKVVRVGTYVAPPATVVSTHNNYSGTLTSYDYTRNFLESVSIDEVNKTITTPYGEVFTYTSSFIGEATGYSCEGNPNAITATGTKARVGEVAVDPKVIPLGTKLFIMLSDGSLIYGYCVAEDTGGAVKGNIIDLYMNTIADCSLIGRSECTVYILSD